VLQRRDPEAALAVLTADHVITPVEVFQQTLATAFAAVEKQPELLITFGITPTHAATGYGYLERGAELAGVPGVFRVAAFREKPSAATAEGYFKSGNYLWNSGMFVWKVRTILEQLKQHLPQSHAGLMAIAAAWDTPDRERVLREIYPTLPKISIDFAVMEKAPQVACVPLPVKWLDVGSWPSYAETLAADASGNRGSNTQTLHLRSERTLVVSEQADEHLVATVGLHDVIIVRTPEVTLVCAAREAEHIKELVAAVREQFGERYC
jgi:mannose-1-phosphate guanylyltransferase